jgi:hypothetical protein
MAFGSESYGLTIGKASKNFDCSTDDYLPLEASGLMLIGWKDPKTVKLIAFRFGKSTDKEPYKHETKKWKSFTLEIDHYNIYGMGLNPFSFDAYRVEGDTITFSNGEKSKSFVKGESEIVYNGSMFKIREVKTEVDTSGWQVGKGNVVVSASMWELTPTKRFNFSDFISRGVLIEQKF